MCILKLQSSPRSVFLDFFNEDVIRYLIERMENLHETDRKTLIYKRMIAIKLFSDLYFGCSIDIVNRIGSPITQNAQKYFKNKGIVINGKDLKNDGKDLTRYLIERLENLRSESFHDGPDDLQELGRLMQCEAFNCMLAILTTIQPGEKFYTKYVFKGDAKSGKLIWQRLLNVENKIHFPLKIKDDLTKKKVIVAIQKEKNLERSDRPSVHFLSDSSLSQDLSSYDFHDSLLLSQMTTKTETLSNGTSDISNSKDENSVNMIEMEQVDFNVSKIVHDPL